MMSRDKNYLQTKSPKLVFSFRAMALAVVALSACASVQGCYWDDSIVKEFIGDQGYLVTCRGRCIHEDIVAKEDCKGDYYVWVEEVKDDKGDKGDDSNSDTAEGGNDGSGGDSGTEGGNASSAPDGSKKAGRCLIQGKAQCEAVAKLPAYEGKDIHWLDLDFQMLDLGGGQYVRFIAKEDYDPQNDPSVRKNMEGDYVCGNYDEVTSGLLLDEVVGEDGKKTYRLNKEKASRHTCTKERIDKMKASFQGRSCPVVSNKCGYVDLLRNDNNAFVDEPIGFCSKCDVQQVMCDAKCVDLRNNAQHCGSCKNDCGNGMYCNQGECASAFDCDNPKKLCTNKDGKAECINPASDETCGATCEENSGAKCDNGKKCIDKGNDVYECGCPFGIELKGYCIDPSKKETCGAKNGTKEEMEGTYCSAIEDCQFDFDSETYRCVCTTGIIATETNGDKSVQICVDPSLDKYCGATTTNPQGTTCNSEQRCVKQDDNSYRCECKDKWMLQCIDEAQPDLVRCLDPSSDEYCGMSQCPADLNAMIKVCGNDQKCESGVCRCQDGLVLCGEQGAKSCIDPKIDRNYCGARGLCNSSTMTSDNYAGMMCGEHEKCVDGECRCAAGYLKCNGKCISVTSDTSCGKTESCDKLVNCQERGRVCINYECKCSKDYVECNGECINPNVSGTHCGARGDCNNDSEESLDYKGDNCAKKNEVCKIIDNGVGEAKCASSCPEGLINCKGECVDQEEYHLNKSCTGCHADYCYTGRVDENGKPIDFNYRLCKSVDTNGVDNKKNSSRFCNGCNVVPYRDDLGENDATSCPPSMYCTGESGLYRCDCKPGTMLCKIPVEGSSDLQSACIPSEHLKECRVEDGKARLICEDGWDDCNGDPTDGCETNLNTSVEHCGVCETNCLETTKGAFGQTCNEGKCDYALCLSGYGDCNDDRTDGCEVDVLSNKEHCGACSKKCEGEYCNNSICYYGDGAENIPSSAECVEGTKKYYYQYDIWKACFGNNRFGCFKNKSVCWSEVN